MPPMARLARTVEISNPMVAPLAGDVSHSLLGHNSIICGQLVAAMSGHSVARQCTIQGQALLPQSLTPTVALAGN